MESETKKTTEDRSKWPEDICRECGFTREGHAFRAATCSRFRETFEDDRQRARSVAFAKGPRR